MLAEEHGGDKERPWQRGDQRDRINGACGSEVGSPAHEWTPHDEGGEFTEAAALEA